MDKIKKELNDYLNFSSDLIFKKTDAIIFGGAIRDIIAEMEIHDIDIMCGPKSCVVLTELLESLGYIKQEGLIPKDLSSIYSDINIISEPITFTRDKKVIQLIRPRINVGNFKIENYQHVMKDLVKEVDLSCCGIYWDGEVLHEAVKGAIEDCIYGVFRVNIGKMNNPKRLIHRKLKLQSRGWKEVEDTVSKRRELKINYILSEEKSKTIVWEKDY